MDEYEKRMFHKAAIDALVNITTAFRPDAIITGGKEKLIEGELAQRYTKRWVDMAYNLLEKAELLGTGYADYCINLLGLTVAKHETTP